MSRLRTSVNVALLRMKRASDGWVMETRTRSAGRKIKLAKQKAKQKRVMCAQTEPTTLTLVLTFMDVSLGCTSQQVEG